MVSGSRPITPEPLKRSMASLRLALPLAKWAPKTTAAPVSRARRSIKFIKLAMSREAFSSRGPRIL